MTRVVVLTNGCFDILHYGHLEHLRAARALGDWLIVTLTGDAFVNKGPGRPVFCAEKRAAMLRELRCVDEVIISNTPTPMPLIERIRPAIYCKGIDYRGMLQEQAAVEALGVKVVFTDTAKFSSSDLLGWV